MRQILWMNALAMLIWALMGTVFLLWSGVSWAQHPAGHSDGMSHGVREIPEGVPVPRIGLRLYKDDMSGFNLELDLVGYRLLPPLEDVMARESEIPEGHAHLYVNGNKMARIYGRYTHVPEDWLKQGVNVITVSLNHHHHDAWVKDGKEIQATLTIMPKAEKWFLNQYSSSPLALNLR